MKIEKVARPDRIIGEMLKKSGTYGVDFFMKFFNALFEKGIFPTKWTESVVLPMFKKGDVNNPNNYRGILLCDTAVKFTVQLLTLCWDEVNKITGWV